MEARRGYGSCDQTGSQTRVSLVGVLRVSQGYFEHVLHEKQNNTNAETPDWQLNTHLCNCSKFPETKPAIAVRDVP